MAFWMYLFKGLRLKIHSKLRWPVITRKLLKWMYERSQRWKSTWTWMVSCDHGVNPIASLLRLSSQQWPQVRLEFDMITARKHAIYSSKYHDYTRAFFKTCVLSFFNVTHVSPTQLSEVMKLGFDISSYRTDFKCVSLSFDVGRRCIQTRCQVTHHHSWITSFFHARINNLYVVATKWVIG